MVDTSIIERKIYSNVMDTCFNAIVVEAFVNSVPIDGSEMTDELRDSLSHYAAECLTDLGSSRLLTEALESVKNHTSRLSAPEIAYLKQINNICMETAQGVTARIIEENKGNDDALKAAADKVALTQSEFERFSKAAANVTPDALSKMIQNKTLDTIKEEKAAFQKDKELELEIVNAINAVSDEENPDEIPPEMGDVGTPPKAGADIGQNAAPGNEEPQSEEPVGESIAFSENDSRYSGSSPAMEGLISALRNGWRRLVNKVPADQVAKDTKPGPMQPGSPGSTPEKTSSTPPITVTNVGKDGNVPNPEKFSFIKDEMSYLGGIISFGKMLGKYNPRFIELRAIGVTGPKNLSAVYFTSDGRKWDFDGNGKMAMTFLTMVELCNLRKLRSDGRIITAYSFTFFFKNGELDERGGKNGSATVLIDHEFNPVPDPKEWMMKHRPVNDNEPIRIANHGDPDYESYGFSTRKAMESYVGVQKKVSEDAMDAFMKSVAGQNYRRKHSSIFSRLQELAYEGILATTESYDSIPFGTMAAITKENTFSQFNSHRSKDLKATMESVSRYDFESIGTPDGPTKEQLSNGLLVASIIYTFFETLNSMNLFCPKLNEIRAFVDETIPIKDRVALDQKQFMDFFRSVIANAKKQLQGVSTVPDVDVIQKDLDVVREHTAAPGFDDDRREINEAIESLQAAIDAKRDAIIKATTQSVPKVDESAYESMMRTTDTLKFTRVANIAGRKPIVASFRCKIDPSSKYICMEALNASGVPVGRNSFALESRIPRDGLVDFVTTAVKSSKLMTCGKRVVVSDKKNGKIYLDTTKL